MEKAGLLVAQPVGRVAREQELPHRVVDGDVGTGWEMLLDEVSRQRKDVVPALGQGGGPALPARDPVEEVGAEAAIDHAAFDALADMLADPDYRAAVVNRTAAVLDSRLVRFAPGEGGPGFG